MDSCVAATDITNFLKCCGIKTGGIWLNKEIRINHKDKKETVGKTGTKIRR